MIVGVWSGLIASAQDIHFSQFYQSPFNLNPALTGQFEGAYRFVANQRTQWRSVTTPYSTFGVGADARDLSFLSVQENKREAIASALPYRAGLSFFHDKAGDSKLATTLLNLAIAREFQWDNTVPQHLSIGAMTGLTSMRIDYSSLTYDNQWNGWAYDPSISSGENYARDSRAYLNVHLGLEYGIEFSHENQLYVGASAFNLTGPKQSFFDDGYVRLQKRWHFYGRYHYGVNDRWKAEPMLLFSTQGVYHEWLIGGLAHWVIQQSAWANRSVYFGLFGRLRDAGFAVVGMQYDAWNVGISYDINTSNLRPASNGRGGFELSLVYIIPPKPKAFAIKYCPDYQ